MVKIDCTATATSSVEPCASMARQPKAQMSIFSVSFPERQNSSGDMYLPRHLLWDTLGRCEVMSKDHPLEAPGSNYFLITMSCAGLGEPASASLRLMWVRSMHLSKFGNWLVLAHVERASGRLKCQKV